MSALSQSQLAQYYAASSDAERLEALLRAWLAQPDLYFYGALTTVDGAKGLEVLCTSSAKGKALASLVEILSYGTVATLSGCASSEVQQIATTDIPIIVRKLEQLTALTVCANTAAAAASGSSSSPSHGGRVYYSQLADAFCLSANLAADKSVAKVEDIVMGAAAAGLLSVRLNQKQRFAQVSAVQARDCFLPLGTKLVSGVVLPEDATRNSPSLDHVVSMLSTIMNKTENNSVNKSMSPDDALKQLTEERDAQEAKLLVKNDVAEAERDDFEKKRIQLMAQAQAEAEQAARRFGEGDVFGGHRFGFGVRHGRF